jgi:predicted nicotinamide N-methyase
MPALIADRKAFIRANTRLKPVAARAGDLAATWPRVGADLAEDRGRADAMGLPPPYWAFAWAGGQALARYVLDHPQSVAGNACSISRPAPGWSRSRPPRPAPRR